MQYNSWKLDVIYTLGNISKVHSVLSDLRTKSVDTISLVGEARRARRTSFVARLLVQIYATIDDQRSPTSLLDTYVLKHNLEAKIIFSSFPNTNPYVRISVRALNGGRWLNMPVWAIHVFIVVMIP